MVTVDRAKAWCLLRAETSLSPEHCGEAGTIADGQVLIGGEHGAGGVGQGKEVDFDEDPWRFLKIRIHTRTSIEVLRGRA